MTAALSGPRRAPRSGGPPKQAVVLLHGYGADGSDLIGLADGWREILPEALFVAPDAPAPAARLGAGRQWFEIDFVGEKLASRQTGVIGARPVLSAFLADLWKEHGLAARDTLLVGFSQGAMMALHVGFSLSEPLMGIVAFSGAFLPPEGFGADSPRTPVCLVHGDIDGVVDPALSAEAASALRAAGIPVACHVSPGVGHGIGPDGLAFASRFITGLISAC